jgi:inorganic pyrophosphatase
MIYKDLPAGKNVPTEINALIEISMNSGNVKYEFDRASGAIIVDRLRDSPMNYPVNYGCMPQTISDDGDPLDILVWCPYAIQTGTVISVRPVGVLIMEDEKGIDVKIIAVPADSVSNKFLKIQDINDIGEDERDKIEHFFKHYKDLDGGKDKKRWSEVTGWEDVKSAHAYILKGIEGAKPAPPALPFVKPKIKF